MERDVPAEYGTVARIRPLPPTVGGVGGIEVTRLRSGATAGDVVRRAIAGSAVRVIEHDPVMRVGADPEGVHQARVGARRLGSDLKTFRSLLDPDWVSHLADEIGWLGGILGSVRDGDVMLARLRGRAPELPAASGAGVARVLVSLESQRDEAHATLMATLRAERYLSLLDRLVDAAEAPAFVLEADRPAAAILPHLAGRPWHKLERRVRALGPTPTDEALHDVRIRTKRVRYAAEAVQPLIGRDARRFANAAARLQDVLGDLHDALVAESWLRTWAGGGRAARAARLRTKWRKHWGRLSAPQLTSWM